MGLREWGAVRVGGGGMQARVTHNLNILLNTETKQHTLTEKQAHSPRADFFLSLVLSILQYILDLDLVMRASCLVGAPWAEVSSGRAATVTISAAEPVSQNM